MNDLEQFEKFPLLKNFQIGCRNINNKAIQHELERLIKIGHLKENFYNYNCKINNFFLSIKIII